MSFKEFLIKADPHKTYRCAGCGTLLARNPAVWVLLLVCGLVFGALGVFTGTQELGMTSIVLSSVLVIVIGTLMVKVIAYKLIGWRVAPGK